jgi:hypothetical protein
MGHESRVEKEEEIKSHFKLPLVNSPLKGLVKEATEMLVKMKL